MAGSRSARIFTDQLRVEQAIYPFAGGHVVVFSARSPERESGNQDGAAVLSLDSKSGVLAVADGLGGQPGGASAADITLEHLKDAVTEAGGSTASRGEILDGIEAANTAVLSLGIGAATTLSVAEIRGGQLRSYQVGDSAILVVGQRGKVKLQTLSHSPVGYALEAGLMDEQEALHHDERHLVSNMVGAPDMRIEVGTSIALAPRDTTLLATDGLLDNLTLQEIIDHIRTGSLSEAARDLAGLCEQRMNDPESGAPSKPDDVTFVLFRRGH